MGLNDSDAEYNPTNKDSFSDDDNNDVKDIYMFISINEKTESFGLTEIPW